MRVCVCVCVCVGGGGYLATLRNKSVSRTELNQTKHPIGDFQGCPQGYKFLFFLKNAIIQRKQLNEMTKRCIKKVSVRVSI